MVRDFPLFPLGIVASALGVQLTSNVWLARRTRAGAGPVERTLGSVLLLDVALLTVLVLATGGPSNPFTISYLVYITLAAVTLRTFEHRILPVVLECAGHRRAELDRPGDGLPWGVGAVSEAVWTGVSLGDVLRRAGLAEEAVELLAAVKDGGAGDLDGHHAVELRVAGFVDGAKATRAHGLEELELA